MDNISQVTIQENETIEYRIILNNFYLKNSINIQYLHKMLMDK